MGVRKINAYSGLWKGAVGGAFRAFLSNQSGASLIMFALALPVTFGMVALSLDVTSWLMTKRVTQNVADMSSLAGASVLADGGGAAEVEQAALDMASRNNFVHGVDGEVIVNNPPATGPQAGNLNYVEVIVAEPREILLAGILKQDAVTVQSRAVSGLEGGLGCVLALDPTADGALTFSGAADATIACGIYSNSNSDSSILVGGSADLTADPAIAVGGIVESGSGTITSTNPLQPYSTKIKDPYYDLVVPSVSGCDETDLVVGDTRTLSPGVYCGGLQLTVLLGKGKKEISSADVTLDPGVYIIHNGDLSINGKAKAFGRGSPSSSPGTRLRRSVAFTTSTAALT